MMSWTQLARTMGRIAPGALADRGRVAAVFALPDPGHRECNAGSVAEHIRSASFL